MHAGEMYGGTQLLVVYVNAIVGSILTMESSGSFITTEVAKHFIVQSSIFLYLPKGKNYPQFPDVVKWTGHEGSGLHSAWGTFSHCLHHFFRPGFGD